VATPEAYDALPKETRASFDLMAVMFGEHTPAIMERQVAENKNLKWVHSLSAGID